ncbi:MAG: hypothetical protein LBO02_00035 [Holosporaceae bacterium]|nr:hypothetical protein [Holosporaceae bacterium]
MKRILLISSALIFSSIMVCENIAAWPWSKKKDDNVDALNKNAGIFSGISRQAASISTSVDGFTQKNYAGENDVAHLLPFRILTKNVSELFNWVYILVKDIKSDFDKLQSAQRTKESTKSEKQSEKADNNISIPFLFFVQP